MVLRWIMEYLKHTLPVFDLTIIIIGRFFSFSFLIFLFIYLFIYLSIYLFVYLLIYLSLCLFIYLGGIKWNCRENWIKNEATWKNNSQKNHVCQQE